MNDIVAIIIARGGSRRLPRKNVRPFCGKPLVEWSILQARCTRCLTEDDIFLSTDDDEIAEIGARNHIHVIRRPDWPDADLRSAMPVFMHALEEIRMRRLVELTLPMLPTCPCRLPGEHDRALALYQALKPLHPDCREIVSYQPFREMIIAEILGPIARNLVWDKHGGHMFAVPVVEIKEAGWWDDMQDSIFYDAEDQSSERALRFMRRPIYWLEGQWWQAFDIDDQETFELNELLFERYILQGRGEAVYWDYRRGEE